LSERSQRYESEVYGSTLFRNIEFGSARALTGVDDVRILVDGKLSLNIVKSTKYGYEIHIQVYAPEHRVEHRNPSKWSRVEIYFPTRDLGKLIEALIRLELRMKGMNV